MPPSAETDKDGSNSTSTSSTIPKACEGCRTRKIRCNRVTPCSNCISSGIACRPAKAAEHRPRILVSNNYERQIEMINERLISIEKHLKSLSPNSSLQLKDSPRSIDDQLSTAGDSGTPIQHEGLSSFHQQSNLATELAEHFGGEQTAELNDAIKSLKNLLSHQPTVPNCSQQLYFSDSRAKLPEMEVLPAAFVLALLKQYKETPSSILMTSPSRDGRELELLCQKTYFPTTPLTLGEQTAMYGMLYELVMDCSEKGVALSQDWNLSSFAAICRRNFTLGLETYEILAVPTHYNAMSLMLGSILAQNDRRIALAWMLSVTAARHVQALGYHRESVLRQQKPEKASEMRHLFWTIYSLEKNSSLALGRASALPDYAIDVEMFSPSQNPGIRPWDEYLLNFMQVTRIQGQIYEQLYSPMANKKSGDERMASMQTLSASLNALQAKMYKIDGTHAYCPEELQHYLAPSEIVYYSLLTLIYRASSRPEEGPCVSSQCFEAARMALQTHLQIFPNYQLGGEAMIGSYVNWGLLYCSFTPFIVIFLHAIASHSVQDIELLEKVTSSLEHAKFIASDVDKLHQTCQVFCRVARVIMDSNQNLMGVYNQQNDSFQFLERPDPQFPQSQQVLPEIFNQEFSGPFTSTNMDEMSMFFGNFIGGTQPVMDLFSVDFGDQEM